MTVPCEVVCRFKNKKKGARGYMTGGGWGGGIQPQAQLVSSLILPPVKPQKVTLGGACIIIGFKLLLVLDFYTSSRLSHSVTSNKPLTLTVQDATQSTANPTKSKLQYYNHNLIHAHTHIFKHVYAMHATLPACKLAQVIDREQIHY